MIQRFSWIAELRSTRNRAAGQGPVRAQDRPERGRSEPRAWLVLLRPPLISDRPAPRWRSHPRSGADSPDRLEAEAESPCPVKAK